MSASDNAPSEVETRVRASFERQRAMETIGARLTHVGPGTVDIEMDYRPELTQQHGFLHAGIISTALDSACGYAGYSLMPEDAGVLSIEFKINLLAPGKGTRFLFKGAVTKPGRTIMVADGQAFAFDAEGKSRLMATMTVTLMVIKGREDVVG